MNIDERIKRELEQDTDRIDEILAERDSLLDRLKPAYRGGLKRYVYLTTVIALALTALILWSGFRFFTASSAEDLVYWGVILIVVLLAQVATKLWIWMEMHRASMVRETKRLEIAVARLTDQVERGREAR